MASRSTSNASILVNVALVLPLYFIQSAPTSFVPLLRFCAQGPFDLLHFPLIQLSSLGYGVSLPCCARLRVSPLASFELQRRGRFSDSASLHGIDSGRIRMLRWEGVVRAVIVETALQSARDPGVKSISKCHTIWRASSISEQVELRLFHRLHDQGAVGARRCSRMVRGRLAIENRTGSGISAL